MTSASLVNTILLANVDIYDTFPALEQRVDYFLYDWDDDSMFLTSLHLHKKVIRDRNQNNIGLMDTKKHSNNYSSYYTNKYDSDYNIYPRAENLLKRIWKSNKSKLSKYPPQKINWNKDADPFFLYGPVRKSSPDLPCGLSLRFRNNSTKLKSSLKYTSVNKVFDFFASRLTINTPKNRNCSLNSNVDDCDETLNSYSIGNVSENVYFKAMPYLKYTNKRTNNILQAAQNVDLPKTQKKKLRFNKKVQQCIIIFEEENPSSILHKTGDSPAKRQFENTKKSQKHSINQNIFNSINQNDPLIYNNSCSVYNKMDWKLTLKNVYNTLQNKHKNDPSLSTHSSALASNSVCDFTKNLLKVIDSKVPPFAEELNELIFSYGNYSIRKRNHTITINLLPTELNDCNTRKRKNPKESFFKRFFNQKSLFSLIWAERLINFAKAPEICASEAIDFKTHPFKNDYSQHDALSTPKNFNEKFDYTSNTFIAQNYNDNNRSLIESGYSPNSNDDIFTVELYPVSYAHKKLLSKQNNIAQSIDITEHYYLNIDVIDSIQDQNGNLDFSHSKINSDSCNIMCSNENMIQSSNEIMGLASFQKQKKHTSDIGFIKSNMNSCFTENKKIIVAGIDAKKKNHTSSINLSFNRINYALYLLKQINYIPMRILNMEKKLPGTMLQKNDKSQIFEWIADTEADTTRRYAKSGFIEKRFIKECLFCRNIAPETIEHMLLECSRWQALRADILAQYINIYRAQVATNPLLLSASISMRLVCKLLGKGLKLSSTNICKNTTLICVKTTLATAKFLNANILLRYIMLNSLRLVSIPLYQFPQGFNVHIDQLSLS
ncbi:hypothetical protein BB561_002098 [Smittium simulii]|uniref:Uncharacterized protein n=1 Tax=Smittium simulii TaxID=133385 RepID=A0A2T9YRT1_9FUNG|nr:hypothetical protein BB561_002098 [Smittium simulii]